MSRAFSIHPLFRVPVGIAAVLLVPGIALACGMVDLKVIKDGPATAKVGDTVTYILTVAHTGTTGKITRFTLTDTLPQGVSLVNVIPALPAASCSILGTSPIIIDCRSPTGTNFFDLTPGKTLLVANITVQVQQSAQCTTIVNTVHGTSFEQDVNLSNNTATLSTKIDCPPPPPPNLIVKKIAPPSAPRGGQITYTLRAENIGQSAALQVKVTDPIPSGLTFIGAQGANCTVVGNSVSCAYGQVLPGMPEEAKLTFASSPTIACGPLQNSASISTTSAESDTTDNHVGPVTTQIECPPENADVSMEKTAPATVEQGGNIIYVLRVRNAGPAAAQNVVVTDPLAIGLTFLSVNDPSCTLQGNTVRCEIGTLPSGGFRQIEIKARVANDVPCETVLNNYALASTSTNDTYPGNNQSPTVQTRVLCVVQNGCITVIKELFDENGNPLSGPVPAFTFRLNGNQSVQNDSQGRATFSNVPAGTHVVSEQQLGGWELLSITPPGGQIVVQASPTCAALAFKNKRVQQLTDVIVAKWPLQSNVQRGGLVTYEFGARNIGNVAAASVVVRDTVPAGLVYESSNGNCTLQGNDVDCAIGTLQPFETRTIQLTFRVSTTVACGSVIPNSASIRTTTPESNPHNNQSETVPVTVTCPQEFGCIEIRKRAFDPSGNLMSPVPQFTFRLDGGSIATVNNAQGNARFDNVTVGNHFIVELVPPGWTPLTITPPNGEVTVPAGNQCPVVTVENKQNAPVQTDVSIEKASDRTTVQRGGTIIYTLRVRNLGAVTAQNVRVNDQLPSGVTFVNATGSSCAVTVDGRLSCDVGTLNASQSRDIIVTVSVATTAICGSTLSNIATMTTSTPDTNQGNNFSIPVYTTVECPVEHADVSVEKTSPATVQKGGTLIYSIRVRNLGPTIARNIVVSDALPTGVTFLGATGASCALQNTVVSCILGDLTNGQIRDITLSVSVPQTIACSTILRNTSTVASANDNNGANNTSVTVSTTVECPVEVGCILVKKEALDTQGNILTSVPQFTFNLDGNARTVVTDSQGNARFDGISAGTHTVAEVLPTGWRQVSFTPANGQVVVSAGNACAGVVAKNQQNAVTTNADLSIEKTGPSSVIAGGTLSYELRVRNNGPEIARSVSITDALPTGVQYLGATGGNCSLQGSTVTCSLGDMQNAETKTIVLTVRTDYTLGCQAQLQNRGSVFSSTTDSNQVNNTSQIVQTRVDCVVENDNFDIRKTDNRTEVEAGDELVYEIEVRNNSSRDARDVTVTDRLPEWVEVVDVSDNGRESGDTIRWTNLYFPAHGVRRFFITVRVDDDAEGGIVLINEARVAGRTARDSTRVIARERGNANISVTKFANPTEVFPGGTVEYIVTVRNTGTSELRFITVTDVVESGMLEIMNYGDAELREPSRLGWRVERLTQGEARTFRYVAHVPQTARAGDAIRNRVTAVSEHLRDEAQATVSVLGQLPQTGIFVDAFPPTKTAAAASVGLLIWIATMGMGLGMGAVGVRKMWF